MKIRLLLLSGANLVGQNILAALSGIRSRVHLTAINSVAAEPTLFNFDEVFLSRGLSEEPDLFEHLFQDVLESNAPDLVIPCRDDDVSFLARMRESRPERSARFLCGSAATATAMLDKEMSWNFSRLHGLPFVETISAEASPESITCFAQEHGFPLIAKPRQGFASRGVFLVLDHEQLSQIVGTSGYILQKFLGDATAIRNYAKSVATRGIPLFHTFEPIKLSIQSLIAPDGRVAGMISTRNTMRQGRSDKVTLADDPEVTRLGELCAKVFSEQGWRGPLNIQCQRDLSGELCIYEYNGRFTGATSARYLLGFDEVGLAIETFCGATLNRLPAAGRPASPTEIVRLPISRAFDREDVDVLLRSGYWCKA